jgi:hypothetical protein
MYAHGVQAKLRKLGHHVELIFADQLETLQKVCAAILAEEIQQLKKRKTSMDTQEQLKFVKQWKTDNEIFLNNVLVLGLSDGPQMSYLMGILFAPSSSRHLVPLLQDVN